MSDLPSVLFIDDDATVLASLERTVVGLPIEAAFEADPRRAVDRLARETFDLVVSDQRMPHLCGIEVLEQARRLQPLSHRILLTGHADLETAMAAINRGQIHCLLTKPWDVLHLRETVLSEARAASFTRHASASGSGDALTPAITAIVSAIEAKDPYTRGHSEVVSRFSEALAEALGLPAEIQRIVRIGGLLHDCGKIGVPERILNKPGPLSDEEFALMKRHTEIGEQMVRPVAAIPREACQIVLHHHERWDGMGYPSGLEGEAIPLHVRIVTVADACEAMTAFRVHRAPRRREVILEELTRQAGHHFDPQVAGAARELIESGRFALLRAGVSVVAQRPASEFLHQRSA